MTGERKKLGFEILLDKLGKNAGRLFLVNLMYAVPLGLSFALMYLVNIFVNLSPVVYPFAFVLSAPFFAGVVVLSRDLSQGLKPEKMLKRFLKAAKENWLKFIILGFMLYVSVVICYFSLVLYISFAQSMSWVFYIPLAFSILICVALAFFFFSAFLMVPSFELKFSAALKNSALAILGEAKQNFFALFSCIIYLMVALMPIVILFNLAGTLGVEMVTILVTIYIFAAILLLIPSPVAMMVSHFLYPFMLSVIGKVGNESEEEKIAHQNEEIAQGIAEDIADNSEDLSELLQGDDDDYVFYKGKMIKRRVLKSILDKEC